MQCRGTVLPVLPLFVAPCQKKTNPYNNLFTINTIQKNVHLSAVRIYFGRTLFRKKNFSHRQGAPVLNVFCFLVPSLLMGCFFDQEELFFPQARREQETGKQHALWQATPCLWGKLVSKQPANKQQQAASKQPASKQQASSQQASKKQAASKQQVSSKQSAASCLPQCVLIPCSIPAYGGSFSSKSIFPIGREGTGKQNILTLSCEEQLFAL